MWIPRRTRKPPRIATNSLLGAADPISASTNKATKTRARSSSKVVQMAAVLNMATSDAYLVSITSTATGDAIGRTKSAQGTNGLETPLA